MYRFIIHPDAQQEYEQSIEWYWFRSPQATENFITTIASTIDNICSNPQRFQNTFNDYYELGVKKFPFSIIYTIDDINKLVEITSIFHHSRNPKKKYKK